MYARGAGIDACVRGRRFQTDARAKPAHPEVGTASGASVAQALTSVSEIERKLASLRMDADRGARMRTSVMTHIAWVPEEWVEAAEDVLAGLAERHPSRTIVLFPQSGEGGLEGEVSVESFAAGESRSVCTDTIRIHLHGASAEHQGSVVEPLLISDLPVFLRWRGVPD